MLVFYNYNPYYLYYAAPEGQTEATRVAEKVVATCCLILEVTLTLHRLICHVVFLHSEILTVS